MNRLTAFLKSTRLWGLLGTAVLLWFLAFIVFGKIDVSGIMPDTEKMARRLMRDWPQLPFFQVEEQKVTDGKEHYIYYTVPTRQLSPQELRNMGVTNAVAHPARPK